MSSDIVQLSVRDKGFTVVVHAELPVANKVDWSDIKKIEVFRSDENRIVTVRLKISLYWGRHRLLIDDTTSGFDEFSEALDSAFPSIARGWQVRIRAPFGYPHHEVIYEDD